MPWIARDKTGKNPYRIFGQNPYRIFGQKPQKLMMVNWDGERLTDQFTWSMGEQASRGTYKPLANNENTEIDEKDSPVSLEPGEGPVEVSITLATVLPPRTFEGAGI